VTTLERNLVLLLFITKYLLTNGILISHIFLLFPYSSKS